MAPVAGVMMHMEGGHTTKRTHYHRPTGKNHHRQHLHIRLIGIIRRGRRFVKRIQALAEEEPTPASSSNTLPGEDSNLQPFG